MRRGFGIRALVAVAILAVLYACVGGSYTFKSPPSRDCPITSLLLDETSFPSGAQAADILSPKPGAPISRGYYESAGRTIYLGKGVANHSVYRNKTSERAAREFQRRKELRFSTDKHHGPWEKPTAFTYCSPIADQYYVACGTGLDRPMCKMIAQYEEYHVYFTTHMTPSSSMAFEDLEHVLQAIDEHMAECLNKPLLMESTGK